ncbi:HAMP domain-containing protein [Sphingomonas sinipercae]|uniref:histidine kinase n=1 Tax=Sphingomonas sinipercae TaxID=2714944 RepID=A0A6G7ZM28_9SPHN|nr:ATP-binding protein [Sphingomonas sinipercae]QIL01969.1 HAMP domain-containing protein [Sphingomonas sinipercae]
MSRLSRAPLFAQTLALVVTTVVAMQLTTFAVLMLVPMPHSAFSISEIADTLRGLPPPDDGRVRLSVKIVDAPPEGWEKDDPLERRIQLTVAQSLRMNPADIRVEQQVPIPGGMMLLRLAEPKLPENELPTEPYARGGATSFEDAAVAARLQSGRWVVVSDPIEWLGISKFLLSWLAASALVLITMAWAFTRRVVNPIRAFAETAEAAGRGDPDATFAVAGPREVRTAAQALSEMQRRIRGAVEERTKLLAAIAHDLRAPLTRLRFRAEYAPADHRDRIVQDIERMDSMIGGVLAFVKGEERDDRHRLDFSALVHSAADDWSDSGADVTVAEALPVQVEADPLALRRLISNIIENAIKYAGSARCSVGRDGDSAFLLVDDDGPGISEDSLERVFTPFERGDSTRDPATGGVGLGLALARGIARAHGGDVWLTNRSPKGVRVHVRLPAASAGRREPEDAD